MIKSKKEGSLIVISGPSGAGKGSICSRLIDCPNLKFSISATSRPIRETEVDKKDYYFITKEKFEQMIKDDEFLEYATVHSQYYGTPKSKVIEDLNKGYDVVLEIDIQGALKIKEKYPEGIFIFIMPPSMKDLIKRLINRNTESKDKIIERFKNAYKEINEMKKYNYVVVNDNLDDAINKVKSIILSEKCRVDRIEDIDLDSSEEIIHELLVDFNDK